MQRLANVEKWFVLPADKALNFENKLPRRVRLDVNAPSPVQLFYNDGDGNVTFLANVVGRDVVEFRAYGEFALTAVGADLWLYTVDGENVSFVIPDAVIYTKMVERRARNPELEMMQHLMARNIEKRMEQQRHELEQLWNRREQAAEARAKQPAAAKPAKVDPEQPEPPKASADAAKPAPDADGSGKPKAKGD